MKKLLFFALGYFFCHASATQEPQQKKLRFFNLDLHISVIADVKNILQSLGHEVVDWSISGHTWVFGKGRAPVEVVNENTWGNLSPAMCDQFYERYKTFLDQFDGFIVTHTPAFALLYANCNKPIIIVNSTRYESPLTRSPVLWQWLNDYLQDGVRNNKIFIVSNNKGDSNYLRYYTGIESEVIPSLCLYTNAKYTGIRNTFCFHTLWDAYDFNRDWQPIADRIGLFSNLAIGYAWQDLYNAKGIVHFPYQISTMSLFEQYSANVPLFVPSKEFLFELHRRYPNNILCHLSFLREPDFRSNPLPAQDLNNVLNENVVKHWIEWADYYDTESMPYIQYFDSFEHLEQLLREVDCVEISNNMAEHNKKRQAIALEKWQNILNKVYESHKN
jgi:hypothetical protein